MRHAMVVLGILISLACAGCDALAATWPDRQNRTPPEMLTDVVRWQQRLHVRESTGELASECFTDVDFAAFRRANVPGQVVTQIKAAADFGVITAALRALPRGEQMTALRAARQVARPTWREMGYIDRQGRGQTEAGHAADLQIARAITDAFAGELGVSLTDGL